MRDKTLKIALFSILIVAVLVIGFYCFTHRSETEQRADLSPVVASTTLPALGDLTIEELNWYAVGAGVTAGESSHPTATVHCLDVAVDHIAETDCLQSLQQRLDTTIPKLTKAITEALHKEYPDATDAGFRESLEKGLNDWHSRATGEGGEQSLKCSVESMKSYGGTGQRDDFAICMIRENAQKILWLLKEYRELLWI